MSSINFIDEEFLSVSVDDTGDNGKIYRMTENFFVVYGDTFGKRARLLRQDRKWSQMDLVQKLESEGVKINNTWISQIENSDKMPSVDVAIALAKVLNTTTDFLFLLVDDPKIPNQQEPEFFSPEADEIARIVDSLPVEQRQRCVEKVKRIDEKYRQQLQTRREMESMFASIEANCGLEVRRAVEKQIAERISFFASGLGDGGDDS